MKRKCSNCTEIIFWKDDDKQKFHCRLGKLNTPLGGEWKGGAEFPGCRDHKFDFEVIFPTPKSNLASEVCDLKVEIRTLRKRINATLRALDKRK